MKNQVPKEFHSADIYCQLIPNNDEALDYFDVVPRIGAFEVSCNGIVSKFYFCNLLIFDSYSFPNVCLDAGLIHKNWHKNAQLLHKQLIRVVIFSNSRLPVLLQNKKLRELLLSHNLHKWHRQLQSQLLHQVLQLRQRRHLQQLKLSRKLSLNQQQSKKNQKLKKLLQRLQQQSQKFKRHQSQNQLLIISRNMRLPKVLTTLKLSLNQPPALLFQET